MPIANCVRCDCEIVVERSLAIKRLCPPCKKIRARESSQRRYKRLKQDNRCRACGEPVYKYYSRCQYHHENHLKESTILRASFPPLEPSPPKIEKPKEDVFVVNIPLLREYIRKKYGIQYICEKLNAKSMSERTLVSKAWGDIKKASHLS